MQFFALRKNVVTALKNKLESFLSLFNFKSSPDFEESNEPRRSARFFPSENFADKMECGAGVFPHCRFSLESLLIMIQRL